MEALLQQIISGLATGGIYASIALALVMVYQATHLVNFAQGEMAMFSTYGAWSLIRAGVPYWETFFIVIVASFVAGVMLERFVVRPVAARSVLSVVVIFIGLLVIFNSIAGWIWTYSVQTFPSPFLDTIFPGNKYITSHEFGSLMVMLIELAVLFVFFRFTSLGLAMRAAAHNPISSRLVGVRVDLMLALGWGIAAALGAVAGMMIAPIVFLDPNMMSGILLYGFAGALLGGIDSPAGAVAGGLLLGVLENLAGAYVVGTDLKLTLALVIIVGVLIVRPSGLFGKTVVSRV
jgi:branched-chain amino acid transport system permease protein